ncbi:hypothetical protein H0H87_004388 [Tephrocybe sp. NHM501043]|nr:hypothetical protein H0H87_004388 [Tephrocybe sp. NHM501043]
MQRRQHSFDQFGLHSFATAGNDEGVERALKHGADINSLDTAGRTALMCAVAGEQGHIWAPMTFPPDSWQTIDASNASIMTPRRLNTIQRLLRDPRISLFTLNAPQSSMNGVIPLGMAAWMNMEDAVRILLEESSDTVSVDGMDAHGATALMCKDLRRARRRDVNVFVSSSDAARDGGLRVVQLLLSHGARPDFRDCNHRTSVQFALDHPQILWLCESTLRRHRWRESQSADRCKLFPGSEDLLDLAYSAMPSDSLEPPPLSIFTSPGTSRLTDTLIASVSSSDSSFLRSLLFSPALPASSPPALYPLSAPILVNRPDTTGWSPIHHCAGAKLPCIDVLDALYCAGAEVALFTTHEHFTPLHILARSARLSPEHPEHAVSLYHFTVHLVRDLRAPLAARDKNDETCIHTAAEHGHCIEMLMAFLELDATGSVRELRNARGLTALEVSKPEFRTAFGENAERLRPQSSLSTRTMRAVASFVSLVSFSESQPVVYDDTSSLCSPADLDIEESTHQLLFNLRSCSSAINHSNDPVTLSRLSNLLAEATHLHQSIIRQFRSRVEEANKELQQLQTSSSQVQNLLHRVTLGAVHKLGDKGFDAFQRRRARDSEDSQATMFHDASRSTSSTSIARPGHMDEDHVSVATQTILFDLWSSQSNYSSSTRALTWSDWLGGLISSSDTPCYSDHLAELVKVEHELVEHRHKMVEAGAEWNEFASPGMDVKLKQLEKKHRKLEDKIRELESADRKTDDREVTSPKKGKLRNWFKRIIAHDKPSTVKLQLVYEIDEQNCAVSRQVKGINDDFFVEDTPSVEEDIAYDAKIETALKTSKTVLNAASRDLRTIKQCLLSAEEFIQRANQSISRAERVAKRAVKEREAMITNLRAAENKSSSQQERGTPGALGYSLLTLRPSIASLGSVNSAHSACSVTPTLMENDDEDTRALRRLLLRKVEAGIIGSWDEMDKVLDWLRIVREATRGVKRRAYL